MHRAWTQEVYGVKVLGLNPYPQCGVVPRQAGYARGHREWTQEVYGVKVQGLIPTPNVAWRVARRAMRGCTGRGRRRCMRGRRGCSRPWAASMSRWMSLCMPQPWCALPALHVLVYPYREAGQRRGARDPECRKVLLLPCCPGPQYRALFVGVIFPKRRHGVDSAVC